MNNNFNLRDYLKILWQKKILLILIPGACIVVVSLTNIIRPLTYRTEVKILITSPYEPNNINLPNAPYSLKLFNDLLQSINFRNNVVNNINEKNSTAILTVDNLANMVSIEQFKNSNLLKIKVEGKSSKLLVGIVNTVAKFYIENFNDLQEKEYLEIEKRLDTGIKSLRQNLFQTEEELKDLQKKTKYQRVQQQVSQLGSQISGHENQLRNKKINLVFVVAKIKELKRQLIKEKERTKFNKDKINAVNSSLDLLYAEKEGKQAEYNAQIDMIAKMKKEHDSVSQKFVDYKTDLKRFERKRVSADNNLRTFENKIIQAKLTAKSKQMSANLIEMSTEPQAIDSNLKRDVIFSGIGSLILTVLFIWTCLL